MTSSHFWDFESQTTYNARQADSWEKDARKKAWDYLQSLNLDAKGLPIEAQPPSSADPLSQIHVTKTDLNGIESPVPQPRKSASSVLSKLGDTISDVTDTVFMGPINKPWDLLRPVQRALEAEQQYVARPIAQGLYSGVRSVGNEAGLGLPTYENLPTLVKAGLETLTDPLTYIGPTAVTDAFKVARLAPELKLAAPGLETLFSAPGSKRALVSVLQNAGYGLTALGGGEAARALGLPPLVGGIASTVLAGRAGARLTTPRVFNLNNYEVKGSTESYLRMSDKEFKVAKNSLATDLANTHMETRDEPGNLAGSGMATSPNVFVDESVPWSSRRGSTDWKNLSVAETWRNYSNDELANSIVDNKKLYYDSTDQNRFDLAMRAQTDLRLAMLESQRRGLSSLDERLPGNAMVRRGKPDQEVNSIINNTTPLIASLREAIKPENIQASKDALAAKRAQSQGGIKGGITRRLSRDLQLSLIKAKVEKGISLTEEEIPTAQRLMSELAKRRPGGPVSSMISGNGPDFSKMSDEELRNLTKTPNGSDIPNTGYQMASSDAQIARRTLALKDTSERDLRERFIAAKQDFFSAQNQDAPNTVGALEQKRRLDILQTEFERRGLALPTDKEVADAAQREGLLEFNPYQENPTPRTSWPARPRVSGGASNPDSLQTLIDNVAQAPVDKFGVDSIDEMLKYIDTKKTTTVKGRSLIANFLSSSDIGRSIQETLRQHKIRLQDTDITGFINRYQEKAQQANSYGAVAGAEIRHIGESATSTGDLLTKEINHQDSRTIAVQDQELVSQAQALAQAHPEFGLMRDGILHLDDLLGYANHFDLTPAQRNTLSAIYAPIQAQKDFEKYFGIEHGDENPNGYDVHRQLIKTEVPNEKGILVESPTGPVISARPGSKQTFLKPQSLPSMSAGYAAGNKYLPFYESQSARVAQGYKTMADIWLEASLEGVGQSAQDLMPKNILDLHSELLANRRQLALIDKELARTIHVGLGNAWIPPKVLSKNMNIQNLIAEINIATNIPKKADRQVRLGEIRDQVKSSIGNVETQYQEVNNTRVALMKNIQENPQARIDPITGKAYPSEVRGQYYPLETGQQLADLDANHSPEGIQKVVNSINDATRPVMATLDLSFLGVQGLVAALSNSSAYMKAMSTVFSNGYGDYMSKLYNTGQLHSMIQDGVHMAARNDFAEFIFPSSLRKIPVLGHGMDISNSMFTDFGNVLRSELYKASPMSASEDAAVRSALARNVNLVTGFSPSNPGSLEKMVSFAPRFFRSQLGLVADAVTKHNLSEGGAARSLGTFLALGTALTYTANQGLGQTTDFNPTSPNFMRIRFGGQDISLFGTWDTLVRAVSKETQNPGSGVTYLARVKASPVMSRVFDLIQGQTLNGFTLSASSPGDIILSAAKEASSFLPISSQQLMTESIDPSNPSSIAAAGINFLGTKSTPLSPSERMAIKRDNAAQGAYSKAWNELEPFQKEKLQTEQNLTSPSQTDLARSLNFRKAISDRFRVQQQRLDDSLPVGKAWIDQYHNLKHEQTGAFAQWAQEHPDTMASITHQKPTNANEAARQQFYSLFDTADKQHWSAEETSQALDNLQSSFTSAQSAYIERNTGLKDTPRVQEYKAAQKVLQPYWNMADQIWERLRTKLPQGSQFASVQDYSNDLVSRLQGAGVPDSVIVKRLQTNLVIREVDRATQELRQRLRAKDPRIDAELVKWYGYQATSSASNSRVLAGAR